MDITIQNVRAPALEHNGRFYKVFQPRTRDELLKLHHMGCAGDTVITDIQLEQGDFPTSFAEPTVTQRTLSGLFKDMRSIELELRDQNSTLWSKIQKSNQGALTQFFDTNVKSAIAQTAKEIRQEVRDASNSARVQVTSEGVTIGSTTLTGEQLASTIATSPRGVDIIAPKTKVKSEMIVDGAITASKIAAGSVTANALDAGSVTADKVVMDSAMARRFVSSDLFTDTLAAKTAFINKLRSVVVSATLLEGYKGRIGGFQIGTHDKDPNTFWLTGQNQFAVGMSNGNTERGKTALWVNWGDNWDNPGDYAWFVKRTGEMYCYNKAQFWNVPRIHGNLEVTGDILYFIDRASNKVGYWVHSPSYKRIDENNGYVYLYRQSGGYSWIALNKDISDRRYKTNIKDSQVSGLDVIEQLKTYSYRKEYDDKIEDISCGIMAQDVQRVAPEAFLENPDGAYSYNTFALVPYLIKAIQELKQKVERLEKT